MSNNRRRGPMGGPGRGMAPGEKAKDLKGTMVKLIKYMRRFYVPIVMVIIFAIASTVFNIVGPTILGDATTEIFKGLVRKVSGGSGIDFDKVKHILLMLLSLYVASAIFSFIQGLIMTHVSNNVSYQMRKDISEKIHRMPMKYFESRTYGEVLSRVTNDVDTLGQSLNQSMTQIITSATQIVGVFIMMIRISIPMTIAVLLTLPLSMGLIGLIMSKSQPYFKAQQKHLGELNGQVEEIYSGHNVVISYNGRHQAKDHFDAINQDLYQSMWKSQFFSGIMMPLMQFVGNFGYVMVCIVGAALTINGDITIGTIVAFMTYVRIFTQPIGQMAQGITQLQSASAAMRRVFEFLDEEEMEDESQKTRQLESPKGHVTFEHVRFGYSPDKTIIHDFTAEAKPGQKVAIVGPTGAGKTTMVNLLMRFYDIQAGKIAIDGVDTKSMSREEVHDAFSMVLQDTWLFEGTIRENLVFNQTDISDEAVEAATRAVGVHHFIRTLPNGYDTVLDDSVTLSVGQKQLLTIARALLKDAPLLILDEATSSVDTRTEELIQKAMDKLMEGRTSFVIAHRLSTIRNADLILVMKDGNIIEQGNHQELMSQNGFYADLYNSQFTEEVA